MITELKPGMTTKENSGIQQHIAGFSEPLIAFRFGLQLEVLGEVGSKEDKQGDRFRSETLVCGHVETTFSSSAQ